MYLSLKKALFSWLFLSSLALTSIALPQAEATVPARGEDEISGIFFNYGYPRHHRNYYRDRYYYGNYPRNYWHGRHYPRYYRNYYYDPYNYYDYPYSRDRGGVYFYWGR